MTEYHGVDFARAWRESLLARDDGWRYGVTFPVGVLLWSRDR